MFGGKKKEPEMFSKAYVEKGRLSNIQVFPVPQDLENWIEVDFDPEFNYRGKTYDVEAGVFIDCIPLINKTMLNKRKSAYAARSDALFIEWQFDGTSETEALWRNEVIAIKAEYPLRKEH
jgi:hypothetical protein